MTAPVLPLLYDTDAERRLVAAVAVSPELFEHAGELPATAFRLQDAGTAWGKLTATLAAGGAVVAGDYADFFTLGEVVPLPEFVAEDARRIRQMAYRRDAAETGRQIQHAAYFKPAELDDRLKAATTLEPGTGPDSLLPAAQVVSETWDELTHRDAILARLIPTGLCDLDEALGGGLEPQTLTVLMARPSMGKTAALVQIADYASSRGLVVAVFTKEMSRRQWLRRTAFRRAKASWLAYKQGRLDPDQESAVYQWMTKLSERDTLFIDDSSPQSSADVLAACQRLAKRAGRVDLVLADHLRLFADVDDSEVRRLGKVSWLFKQIATRLDTTCLVAAQINRDVEKQSDRRPDLKDLRDSGQIEENSDAVIGLYRDSYYTENILDKSAEFIIRKSRDGERNARCKFVFQPEYMSFEPMAKGHDGKSNGTQQQRKSASAPVGQGALAHV